MSLSKNNVFDLLKSNCSSLSSGWSKYVGKECNNSVNEGLREREREETETRGKGEQKRKS